jgi:hypothetical protein
MKRPRRREADAKALGKSNAKGIIENNLVRATNKNAEMPNHKGSQRFSFLESNIG